VAETLVKICGMTSERDVAAAVEQGADLIGFILVADSPRGVSLDRGRELAAGVPDAVRTVAVYAGLEVHEGVLDHFDLVQVYGLPTSTERTIVGFRGAPVAVPDVVPVLLDKARNSSPTADALREHWRAAAGVRSPVILAGSLDPDNVAEAVSTARPWAVDTARGVEAEPGIKDHQRMHRFIRNAKDAE
jgi:phosphoribosylanthranilate isomerase